MPTHAALPRRVWTVLLVLGLALPASALRAQGKAPNEDLAAASRLVVKLWMKQGAFDTVKIAHVIGDTLYVAGAPRGLEAIDTQTGLTRWMHVGKYPVDVAPTVFGQTLCFAEGGRLVSVNLANGVELTRVRTRTGILTPIYPTESAWVVGAGDEHVYGLLPATGVRDWRVTVEEYITASAQDGDMACYMTCKGVLWAVNLKTQGEAWHHPFRRPVCSAPSFGGALVFVGCEDYYLYALDAKSGLDAWRVCLSAPVLGTPTVCGGQVYVCTEDGVLHSVQIATGTETWSLPNAGRVLTGTPERLIYLRRERAGNLIGVADTAGGKRLAVLTAMNYDLFAAAPDEGVFYAVARRGGDVVAIADRTVAETRETARRAAEVEREIARLAPPTTSTKAATTTTTTPSSTTTTRPGK